MICHHARLTQETIDPLRAAAYLVHNTRNRPLQPARVRRFVRTIRAGRWRTDAGMIEFDADGVLQNGQHRLAAIVAAGVAVPALVLRQRAQAAEAAA